MLEKSYLIGTNTQTLCVKRFTLNLLEAMPRWTVQADLFTYSTALSSSIPMLAWRMALQFSMTMGSWRVVDGIAVNSSLVKLRFSTLKGL